MRFFTVFIVFMAGFNAVVQAQYNTNRNKKWAFGSHAGLDFSTGVPVPFTTSIDAFEASAGVCTPGGRLLFYTDGGYVYDSTGGLMPHGSGIFPFTLLSAAQGALIVPFIGDPQKFYILSLDDVSTGTMAYSVVDMALHSGLGDVVTPSGNYMGNRFSEKMLAVAGNHCDIWVITRRSDSAVFWSYKITAGGIQPPVVSHTGFFYPSTVGEIRISPNRLHLAETNAGTSGNKGTELFDFNPNTGIVSNGRLIDSTGYNYGVDFSPDNTKLYTGEFGRYTLYQTDISLPSTTAIAASKIAVGSCSGLEDIKLGPDNKIYMNGDCLSALNCVSNPNGAGSLCGFTHCAVTFLPGTRGGIFNNVVYTSFPTDTTIKRHDTTLCKVAGASVTISAHDSLSGSSYYWNDGSAGRTRNITASGPYWVNIVKNCRIVIDTIHVHVNTVIGAISGPLRVCTGQTTTLYDTSLTGVWTSSNPSIAYAFTASGMVTGVASGVVVISYQVPATGCLATASFTVNPAPSVDSVTGGGNYCVGNAGVPVGLNSSTNRIQYELFLGGVPSGSFVTGTGFGLSFGLKTIAGAYTIRATDTLTGCFSAMQGTAIVNVLDSSTTHRIDTVACSTLDLFSMTLTAPTATTYKWFDNTSGTTHLITHPGTYWVRYPISCGYNTDTFHVAVHTPPCNTGTKQPERSKFILTPNPAYNEINISTEDVIPGNLVISNNLGQQMIQLGLHGNNTIVDIQTLPPGLYYVTITTAETQINRKFIKL